MKKIKKILIIILAICVAFIIVELVTSVYNIGVATKNYTYEHLGPMEEDISYQTPMVNVIRKEVKQYNYNEQIPKEEIIAEIKRQSKEFNLGEKFMIDLAFCESGCNNLIKNPKSTAVGVYQYLIGTWNETESWKNHKIARTDYKANIREAMIDISNGENFRWIDCLNN